MNCRFLLPFLLSNVCGYNMRSLRKCNTILELQTTPTETVIDDFIVCNILWTLNYSIVEMHVMELHESPWMKHIRAGWIIFSLLHDSWAGNDDPSVRTTAKLLSLVKSFFLYPLSVFFRSFFHFLSTPFHQHCVTLLPAYVRVQLFSPKIRMYV